MSDLHRFVANLNRDGLQSLINQGVDLNTQDIQGRTPLMFAVQNSNSNEPSEITVHRSIMEMLISAGADLDARDLFGNTAIMLAARFATTAVPVHVLLEAGASPDGVNHSQNHALILAAKNECQSAPHIANLLLEAGANRSHRNGKGLSFDDLIKSNPYFDHIEFKEDHR